LTSSVFSWPGKDLVDREVRKWAQKESTKHPELRRIGYYGSYARDDWGVGSDLDIIAIVENSPDPFDRRSFSWDLNSLPVPAEIMVYTLKEWEHLLTENRRFVQTIQSEAVWI
jgi:predicted nucleotidyltransferase